MTSTDLNARLRAIELPVTKLAKRAVKTMVSHSLARGEGEFLVITGGPGTGKTHLGKQLQHLVDEVCRAAGQPKRCLRVVLEASADLRDLSRQLAREIDNAVVMQKLLQKSNKDLSMEVYNDLRQQQVIFIIFDEAHNLRLSKMESVDLHNLLKWLKNLTYLGICLVFLGVPELAEALYAIPEVVSRCFRREPIQTSALATNSTEAVAVSLQFLRDVQSAYGVDASPPFADKRIAIPLIAATLGNHRDIARLIQGAVTHMKERNATTVILEDFLAVANEAGIPWLPA